ncbi:MAG: DUF6273 domain-containing protein [Ruminococcus sp.]|nr:DUF6273 domain-containing protein [Ruminococcus sp.]
MSEDKILFGGYEWLVLKKYDDHMLVILEDVLEQERPYHVKREFITWEECTLRKWLNEDFYNTFTPEEQARILETHLENPNDVDWHREGGNDTDDKIFLLSLNEVEEYMTKSERNDENWWWVRSSGNCQYGEMKFYHINGKSVVGRFEYDIAREHGVRPSMNLKL